jgi:hypothetical protein
VTAHPRFLLLVLTATLLAGCAAQIPAGPTVAVMPAPYKPFDVFVQDENICRQFAVNTVAPQAQASQNQAVTTAAAGTVLGAATGALIGRNASGAGVGAGIGLLGGSMYGGGQAEQTEAYLQYRYNVAYEQCMYSRGNQVPGFAPAGAAPPPAPPGPR